MRLLIGLAAVSSILLAGCAGLTATSVPLKKMAKQTMTMPKGFDTTKHRRSCLFTRMARVAWSAKSSIYLTPQNCAR
jgi:hypothetical protein